MFGDAGCHRGQLGQWTQGIVLRLFQPVQLRCLYQLLGRAQPGQQAGIEQCIDPLGNTAFEVGFPPRSS